MKTYIEWKIVYLIDTYKYWEQQSDFQHRDLRRRFGLLDAACELLHASLRGTVAPRTSREAAQRDALQPVGEGWSGRRKADMTEAKKRHSTP